MTKLPDNPLVSELFKAVHGKKDKKGKADLLAQYKRDDVKALLIWNFDKQIRSAIPEGEVPYTPNEAPEGTEHTVLASETRKLWHFIKGADNETSQAQKEKMFIQMCEGLCDAEAKVLIAAKDKRLHQVYKGLSKDVVKEAFGWGDDFMKEPAPVYPQAPGSASGV